MKKNLIKFLMCVSLLGPSLAKAEVDSEKKYLINTLLSQTGQSAQAMGKQFSDLFIQQMTIILKKSNPNIDPRAYDILEEEVVRAINEEIILNGELDKMIYPIYDKYFSIADLKKIIEINDTRIGKKMIEIMPLITQEGMRAGQLLGQELGPKIQERVISRFQKEGIE